MHVISVGFFSRKKRKNKFASFIFHKKTENLICYIGKMWLSSLDLLLSLILNELLIFIIFCGISTSGPFNDEPLFTFRALGCFFIFFASNFFFFS